MGQNTGWTVPAFRQRHGWLQTPVGWGEPFAALTCFVFREEGMRPAHAGSYLPLCQFAAKEKPKRTAYPAAKSAKQ